MKPLSQFHDALLHCRTWIAIVILLFARGIHAQGQSIDIVAIGASHTAGKGLMPQDAYPGQLEAMLRAKGYDVHVRNAGVNRDSTTGILQRLASAIPEGTRIVIFDVPHRNDRRSGAGDEHSDNVKLVEKRLRERHIKVITIHRIRALAPDDRQADGIHLTARAHTSIAEHLVPRVIEAIRQIEE